MCSLRANQSTRARRRSIGVSLLLALALALGPSFHAGFHAESSGRPGNALAFTATDLARHAHSGSADCPVCDLLKTAYVFSPPIVQQVAPADPGETIIWPTVCPAWRQLADSSAPRAPPYI